MYSTVMCDGSSVNDVSGAQGSRVPVQIRFPDWYIFIGLIGHSNRQGTNISLLGTHIPLYFIPFDNELWALPWATLNIIYH